MQYKFIQPFKKVSFYLTILLLSALHTNVWGQTGCGVDSKLLFKEDFGQAPDDLCSTTPLANGITTYQFGDQSNNGHYAICTYSGIFSDYWYTGEKTFDHTTNDGWERSMIVNADFEPGKFYTLKMDNLCAGTKLYFSAWVFNLVNPKASAFTSGAMNPDDFADPDLHFEIKDADDETLLASYTTGSIPKVNMAAGEKNWRQFGFTFNTKNSTSVILTIYNNAPGGNGNDLMLDDIEVRLCVPSVKITSPTQATTVVCQGDNITLTGTYIDDGTLGNSLVYRWEYSATGNVDNPYEWTTLTTVNSANPVSASCIIGNMTEAKEGYYRLLVATVATINQPNCRAASKPIRLLSRPKATQSSIKVTGATACYGSSASLTANIEGVSMANPVYRWYSSQIAPTPLFTGQTFTTPNITTNTTYYVSVSGDDYCENSTNSRLAIPITIFYPPTMVGFGGATTVWSGSTQTYTTDAGMTNYKWTVTGGTIISGQDTNSVTVKWGLLVRVQ